MDGNFGVAASAVVLAAMGLWSIRAALLPDSDANFIFRRSALITLASWLMVASCDRLLAAVDVIDEQQVIIIGGVYGVLVLCLFLIYEVLRHLKLDRPRIE